MSARIRRPREMQPVVSAACADRLEWKSPVTKTATGLPCSALVGHLGDRQVREVLLHDLASLS